MATLVSPWVLSAHKLRDPDIAGLTVPADHLAPALAADDGGDALEHCAVCHWLWTVGDTTAVKPAPLVVAAGPSNVLHPGTAPGLGRVATSDTPSRAPPRLA